MRRVPLLEHGPDPRELQRAAFRAAEALELRRRVWPRCDADHSVAWVGSSGTFCAGGCTASTERLRLPTAAFPPSAAAARPQLPAGWAPTTELPWPGQVAG